MTKFGPTTLTTTSTPRMASVFMTRLQTGPISTVLRLTASGPISTVSGRECSNLGQAGVHGDAYRRGILAGHAQHHPAFEAGQQRGRELLGRGVRAELTPLADAHQ